MSVGLDMKGAIEVVRAGVLMARTAARHRSLGATIVRLRRAQATAGRGVVGVEPAPSVNSTQASGSAIGGGSSLFFELALEADAQFA